MYFAPALLKRNAAQLIRQSKPRAVNVAGIYLLISFVMSELSARILGVNMSITKLQQSMNHIEAGNIDNALKLLSTMMPTPMGNVLSILLDVALTVVFAGFNIFLLNLLRGKSPCYGNILDGFGIWYKVILLSVLKTLFIGLWSMLLIIPGIIATFAYSMALYILLDNPEKTVMQCLRESKEIMRGHKKEFFILELSFIGWYLLASFGYVGYITQLWSLPLMNLCFIMFYENLRLNP